MEKAKILYEEAQKTEEYQSYEYLVKVAE